MPNQPAPRHEKNRHHLATCVVVLVAVPVFLLLQLFLPSTRQIAVVSAVVAIAILAVRTAIIEIGVRRPISSGEKKLERNVRGLLDRAFGITFVEDSRDRSEPPGS